MNQGCQSARWCLAFGLFLLAIGTVADEGIHGDASHAMHSLGRVDFPISCSPAAQAFSNVPASSWHAAAPSFAFMIPLQNRSALSPNHAFQNPR